jgi:hypothetical protein
VPVRGGHAYASHARRVLEGETLHAVLVDPLESRGNERGAQIAVVVGLLFWRFLCCFWRQFCLSLELYGAQCKLS